MNTRDEHLVKTKAELVKNLDIYLEGVNNEQVMVVKSYFSLDTAKTDIEKFIQKGEMKDSIYGKKLKQQIYPYFLMYLGVEEKDFEKYMVRDNIFFNIKDYPYNKKLKNYDIFSFMTYLNKNKKEILNKTNEGVFDNYVETL